MQVALVMVKADGTSREILIDRPVTLIGRDEGAKLRIPVSQVSRRHCELVVEGSKVLIRDAGSSNGTYVNGRKTKQSELQPGDLITVGPFVFVVKINGVPKAIDAKDCYAAGTVGLEDDDDDDMPPTPTAKTATKPDPAAGKSPSPAASKPPTGKPSQGSTGKPSIFDDDEDGDVSDLLKDFKFDDDDDKDDDKPRK